MCYASVSIAISVRNSCWKLCFREILAINYIRGGNLFAYIKESVPHISISGNKGSVKTVYHNNNETAKSYKRGGVCTCVRIPLLR